MSNNRRKSGSGRPGPNRAPRPRNIPSVADKAILNEGIYANQRVVHVATSMIGCNVRVEVKNGAVYEGIFKTCSSELAFVLELAHKLDETSSNTGPSRDMLIQCVIFHFADVVRLSAINVDPDYACKDTFTDSAISSKANGPIGEKQLQPWEEDLSVAGGCLLENSTPTTTEKTESNGWDAEEMFKRNSEQFNVKSNYDPSLSQYTTPLKVEDTKEYKDRAEQAAKLAREIENSDAYQSHVALENGDQDEEEKYSAVVRPGGGSESGKYVLPHRRTVKGQGRVQSRTNSQSSSGGRGPNSPTPTTNNTQTNSQERDLKVNGVEKVSNEKSQEWQVENSSSKTEASNEKKEPGRPMGAEKTADVKSQNTAHHENDKTLKELKDFGSTFKLSEKTAPVESQVESSKSESSSTTQSTANSSTLASSPSPQNSDSNSMQAETQPAKKKKVPTATLR